MKRKKRARVLSRVEGSAFLKHVSLNLFPRQDKKLISIPIVALQLGNTTKCNRSLGMTKCQSYYVEMEINERKIRKIEISYFCRILQNEMKILHYSRMTITD